jgi:hypothetical protein
MGLFGSTSGRNPSQAAVKKSIEEILRHDLGSENQNTDPRDS